MKKIIKASFFQRIVVPAVLAILLFVVSVFGFIIPAFENNAIDQKRIMLHELTNTAWSVLHNYHNDAIKGFLTHEEARQKALAEVEALRYGADKKDYFWIISAEPAMVMHPYVHELMGQSLQDYTDPDGKKPFIEAARLAAGQGEGFISYKWQFKDDPTRIVPKLSFVKAFPEWSWIIGTGIYLDDVQREIATLTNKLILILLGIATFIALIIVFITLQSLKIENQRREAELQLHESREKYRSLLESSTEGILLVLNAKIGYSNAYIQNWLQYSGPELENIPLHNLIRFSQEVDFENVITETRMEVALIRKDGSTAEAVLTMLPVSFAEKEGLLLTLKDTHEHRAIKSELEDFRQRFDRISEFSKTGFFRLSLKEKKLSGLNHSLAVLLGYRNTEELKKTALTEILGGKPALRSLLTEVKTQGAIERKQIALRKKDGSRITVSMSLFLNDNDNELICDGIIEAFDKHVSQEGLSGSVKELFEMFAMSAKPAKDFVSPAVSCPADYTLDQAVEVMVQEKSDFVLLTINHKVIGIVTHNNIISRIGGKNLSASLLASECMSSPVVFADELAPLAFAGSLMETENQEYLILNNSRGEISGVLKKSNLFGLYVNPAGVLGNAIKKTAAGAGLRSFRNKVPQLVQPFLTELGSVQTANNILSSFNDAITTQIIESALREAGAPPVPFVFMEIGSAGRKELSFGSDQDNAIVFSDQNETPIETVQEYFLELGRKICRRLDESGLRYCPGDYMASNPKWCQPLSVWMNYFSEWVKTPDPENILNISVFFDLRLSYGDPSLFNRLQEHVFTALKGSTTFYYLLAQSVASFKPPLGVFGGIVTETSGKNTDVIDIKNCILPVVMFARIYALRKNIRHTGTIERIGALLSAGVLNKATAEELLFQYNFLTQQRLGSQLRELSRSAFASNMIAPKKLNEIEQMILKKVFSQMGSYQEKLGAEFMSAFKG